MWNDLHEFIRLLLHYKTVLKDHEIVVVLKRFSFKGKHGPLLSKSTECVLLCCLIF